MTVFVERAPRAQRVVRRWISVRGTLVLQAPAHLGSGDREGPTDMSLVRDSVSDRALLTGASLAGALRSYLRAYQHGYAAEEPARAAFAAKGLAELLFGGRKGDDDGYQSPLIIADALSEGLPPIELRDGVRIGGATRTPDPQGKYDLELLPAGTRFPLSFELAIADLPRTTTADPAAQAAYETMLREGLLIALQGLASGSISLGMKKRRGFGRCSVEDWEVWEFDMGDPVDVVAWLAFGRDYGDSYRRAGSDLSVLLRQAAPRAPVSPPLTLTATFALEGSLLIRAGQDVGKFGPDVRHLHARQPDGNERPVISGTALAGVLRHQAERIANTLVAGSGPAFVEQLFGRVGQSARRTGDPGQASRVVVHESLIEDARTDLVQSRVSIDRFTGGALDGALFSEQPAFARPTTRTTLRVNLYPPAGVHLHRLPGAEPPSAGQEWAAAEVGMLLLLLKDLWTGELAVGGEQSVGRGRLRGLAAELSIGGEVIARFTGDGPSVMLTTGDAGALNACVAAIPAALRTLLSQKERADERD
jgi:CRISPR/Cas system CMR subunit Cmr4 (Cas7 group RAMP superfamily)